MDRLAARLSGMAGLNDPLAASGRSLSSASSGVVSKRWFIPVNLLLLLILARDLADMTWKWVWTPPARSVVSPLSIQPSVSSRSSRSGDVFSFESGMGLFGEARSAPKPVAPRRDGRDAPVTRLNLSLLGIFYTGGSLSLALIAAPGGGEKPYHIGDRVPGNARIEAIHADRVVLDVNGTLQTLRLPKRGTGVEAKVSGRRGGGGEGSSPVVRELWDQFRKRPESILEKLRLEPAYRNGRFEGVLLLSGADPKFLSEFGLKSGDVVTWVNGVALTDPLEGMKVLGTLGGIEELHFRVRRGSETLEFDFYRE